MKWFVALATLFMTSSWVSAAPIHDSTSPTKRENDWIPVETEEDEIKSTWNSAEGLQESLNSVYGPDDSDPNDLQRRGDALMSRMGDADFWASFDGKPAEIKRRVRELFHSPSFLHKISGSINNPKSSDDPESKTIFGVELKKSTEDHVWREAFTSVFDEQSLFKNAAGDLVKAVLRVWGWVSLDLALYQGNGLFKF